MKLERLSTSDLEDAVSVFVDCMYHDLWYEGSYSSEDEMREDFSEYIGWLLRNGSGIGAWSGERLVGIALSFPLSKLDETMWSEWFGETGGLRQVMEEHSDHEYIFALCVEKEYRGGKIGSRLLDEVLDGKSLCIADTTGELSFHMLERRGFHQIYSEEDKEWWRVLTKRQSPVSQSQDKKMKK